MKAKHEVPPTPALTSQSCWVPAHHDPRQNSPGCYKTEEVGGERSDGDGLLGHVYRGEDSTCGPICPLPEGSSEQILSSAQPLFAEAGHSLFFCICLSDFSKREEGVKFSSVSPSGKQCPLEAM